MRIAIVGYGKMGHMIEEIAVQRGHEIVLKINIDNTEEVTLTVYDILGEKVRQIHNGLLNKGRNVFYWDSKDDKNHDISSGIYFVVAKTLYNFKTIKLILLK